MGGPFQWEGCGDCSSSLGDDGPGGGGSEEWRLDLWEVEEGCDRCRIGASTLPLQKDNHGSFRYS